MKRLIIGTATTVFLLSTVAHAGPVEDRQAFMKENGKLIGALVKVAKGEMDFDAAQVKQMLEDFNKHTQTLDVAALFPEGSGGGESKTAPAVWENFDDFTAKAEKLKADAATAAGKDPQNAGDVGAIVQMIGADCGSCHQSYRLKMN